MPFDMADAAAGPQPQLFDLTRGDGKGCEEQLEAWQEACDSEDADWLAWWEDASEAGGGSKDAGQQLGEWQQLVREAFVDLDELEDDFVADAFLESLAEADYPEASEALVGYPPLPCTSASCAGQASVAAEWSQLYADALAVWIEGEECEDLECLHGLEDENLLLPGLEDENLLLPGSEDARLVGVDHLPGLGQIGGRGCWADLCDEEPDAWVEADVVFEASRATAPLAVPSVEIDRGKKVEDPHSLKLNELTQCSFQPQQPLVCDSFKNCEGLSRVAFMDGNGVVMLGKVIACEQKADAADKGGKKK